MLRIDPASQSERDNYKLMIGSIIPRPVALVTTVSKDGVVNAAPFSYFNIVTSNPPMVSVSVQRKNGVPKDTARNAIDNGAFVVHITDEDNVERVNQTAANLEPNESEIDYSGMTAIPSANISVPGVEEAKIRMECVLEAAYSLGGDAEKPACDLLIGRVVCFHIAEDLYENGRINAQLLRPVSRLAGNEYGKLGETFSMDRPK